MSPSRNNNLTPYKCLIEHLAFVQCTRSEGDLRSEEEESRVTLTQRLLYARAVRSSSSWSFCAYSSWTMRSAHMQVNLRIEVALQVDISPPNFQ